MASTLTRPSRRLSAQLLRWALLVAVLPMLLLALLVQWHMESQLIAQQQLHLYSMAREKARLIHEVYQLNKVQLRALSYRQAFARLLNAPQSVSDRDDVNVLAQTLLNVDRVYCDLFLVGQSGRVVYSAQGDTPEGVDVTSSDWQNTGIGKAFMQARYTLGVALTPARYYAPSKRVAFFMATPVWGLQGQLLGVLILQLDHHWLAAIAQSGVGNSATGDITFAQKNEQGQLNVIAPLRFDPSLMEELRAADAQHPILANISITGQEGWGIGQDYRRERVLAGWIYLPSVQAAMVVKQDEREVLSSLRTMRYYTLVLLLLVVTLVWVLSIIISRRLTRPLVHIVDVLQQLTMGRWHIRAAHSLTENHETTQLVSGINQLAETIETQVEQLQHQAVELEQQTQALSQYNADLEAAVKERTQALEQLSIIDPLTGLFNRRHFEKEGIRLWMMVARQRQQLMFLLLDIDYFKQFNDSLGHQAGDGALVKVAKAIQHACQRGSDLAFRIGGEEMAILAIVRDQQDAQQQAKRLRLAIEQLAIPHPASKVKAVLTVSIGIVLFNAQDCQRPTEAKLDTLYRLADQALYRAKSQGRNCVVLAETQVSC